VFCNNCSKNRWFLPDISTSKNSRVCDSCLANLQRAKHQVCFLLLNFKFDFFYFTENGVAG